ncbi:hypothetical protein GCM10027061_21420 [Nesterenkonia suensis]
MGPLTEHEHKRFWMGKPVDDKETKEAVLRDKPPGYLIVWPDGTGEWT